MSPSGKGQLKKELSEILARLRSDYQLSEQAAAEFGQMVYNARFGGAGNRFYAFNQTHSQTGDEQEIGELVFELQQYVPETKVPPLPEFQINRNIKKRNPKEDKCGLQSKSLLMEYTNFYTNHTDNGIIYHGTRNIFNIIGIMRNGFIVSNSNQGKAAEGRGGYGDKNKSIARNFGVPIELKVREEIKPRIIDWRTVSEDENIQTLIKEARKIKMDSFEYLSRYCDIDIIVNTHVLIENVGVIELPKDITAIIRSYISRMAKIHSLISFSYEDATEAALLIQEYISFESLGRILGMKNLPTDLVSKLFSGLDNQDPMVRSVIADTLGNLQSNDPDIPIRLIRSLSDDHKYVRYSTVEALSKKIPSNSAIRDALAQALVKILSTDTDTIFQAKAAQALGGMVPAEPMIQNALVKALSYSDPNVVRREDDSQTHFLWVRLNAPFF